MPLGTGFGAARHRNKEEFSSINSSSSSLSSIDTNSNQVNRSHSMTNKLKSLFKNPMSPKQGPQSGGAHSNQAHSSQAPLPSQIQTSSPTSAAPSIDSPISPILLPSPSSKLPNIRDIEGYTSPTESFNSENDAITLKPRSPIQPDYVQEGHLFVFSNGNHQHIIKNNKKQEKIPHSSNYIMSSLTAWSKSKTLIDHSFSLIEDGDLKRLPPIEISDANDFDANLDSCIGKQQFNLIEKLTVRIENICKNRNLDPNPAYSKSLIEKYGKPKAIVGRGAYGVVKVVSKTNPVTKKDHFFAVKEIKKKNDEKIDHFTNRLLSEFSISSTLNHPNLIKTIDLMKDTSTSSPIFGEIMEYCHGGDLYQLIIENEKQGLPTIEVDCFMKQISKGVAYMHQHGVAHCDLKPENIMITVNGCCKITDFGTSIVFRTAWEKDIHLTEGCVGSEPYVSPEEYISKPYDPTKPDYWALGVIYMIMITGSFLWKSTKNTDLIYKKYLTKRPVYEINEATQEEEIKIKGSFAPIENLKKAGKNDELRKELLYKLLHPDPNKRLTASQLLRSDWMKDVHNCHAGLGL